MPQPSPSTSATPVDLALPAAVLWDMDGTLVDTEPYWLAAEAAVVADFGGEWSQQDALQMIGMPLVPAMEILRAHGVDLPPEELADRLVGDVVTAVRRDLTWQPGALELLGALRDAGVPCALVTMSFRELADAVVARGPRDAFAVTVTGDEVTHGKPHPEPYLRAAELLGVPVEQCVAIEDSPPGIGSALAAGARTLGVQHIAPVTPQPGLSRTDSLARIGLADLARIVSGEVIDHLARGQAG